MLFDEAVKKYQADPTKENIDGLVAEITGEMTVDEKINMLSGHLDLVTMQLDMIKTKRNYNVHSLKAGGCRRLGVPSVKFTDGPRGVVMGNSTCFPVSAVRASSFDTDLEYRVGKVIADEAIAQDANYFAGVCINLIRNPRWGRSQESYSEDPFVLGEFGAALTRSVQEEGMIACPKHYALNSIEDLRFSVNVEVDDRTLHEVYLPHFKRCIDEGAQSIMGAYNRYNEWHCCESRELLTDILRKQWGFDGFVMSDFVWGVYEAEHSLRAGLDIEMMFTMKYTKGKIKKLLKSGAVTEEHLDDACNNILRALIRQVPKIKPRDMSVVGCDKARALAREAAEKGMVLLENNGILPLSKDADIMVCGPYANEVNVGDHGSSNVFDKKVITPYEGLKNKFKNTSLDKGDVAVVCVGSNYKLEGEYFVNMDYSLNEKPKDGGGDRVSLRLNEDEAGLIRDLKKSGKKVVVLLYAGSAVLIDEWKEYADAVIMQYYSGCEGGNALANLLCGDVNFSGHLPVTVAKTEDDYPEFLFMGQKPYEITYGYYHGYTLLDKEEKKAAYPFGYGLSYTKFSMGDIAAEQESDGTAIQVKVNVTNEGDRDGATVVFAYVGSSRARADKEHARTIVSDEDRPIKLLKGFKRVELKAGESREVAIRIPVESLRFYKKGDWVLDDKYKFYAGFDNEDAFLRSKELQVTGGDTNE